jgi:diaminopimelate epimerase
MRTIPFSKFHGFGNDYIVIERDCIGESVSMAELGIKICQRHTGAGADGIGVVSKDDSPDIDYRCEIVNPDGSIAGFSGNGTRCAVACLHYKGLWAEAQLRLATRSGIKNFELLERPTETEFWFKAEIGKPSFASDKIPVKVETLREDVVSEPILVGDRTLEFAAVNVGNPVACVFVNDLDFDWRSLGRSMEVHERFPERANIVFVKVLGRSEIDIRIWERAAGETSASGTCAGGAAVLSAFMSKTDRHVQVRSPGGMTEVLWREDDEIILTGRADYVYGGEWPDPSA